MKKPLSFLLPAVALCAVALFSLTLSCKKEDAQGGDAIYAIELNKTELQLALDETFALTATVPSPEQSIVTWWSSDPEIVSVDEASGLLTALKDEGEVTITATVSSKRPVQPRATATCTVHVVTNYSLSLDYTSVKLAQNGSVTVTAHPAPATGYGQIKWSSSNTTVVKVSSSTGSTINFKGQTTNGKATVTAQLTSRFDGSVKATATCEVEVESFYVEKLNLPEELHLVKGETFQLNPTIEPEQAKDIPLTYAVTSGSSYVSVDNNGVLTAKAISNSNYASVKVASTDEHKYSEVVKVYVDPVPIYPSSASLTGFKDETYIGNPFNTTVTYTKSGTDTPNQHGTTTVTSSDPSVATVTKTASGFTVTPLKAGSTAITVVYYTSATTKKMLTETLTVFSGPPSIYWSNDQNAALTRGLVLGESVTVKALMSSTNHTAVTYVSSNPSVATVDQGKITAKARGTAYITAKSSQYPELTQKTVTFTVYGVPAKVTCTFGNANPIFLRYGNTTTKTMRFKVTDANGNASRQALTVALSGVGNIYASTQEESGEAKVTMNNHRTSSTSTIKGSMTVYPTGYSSLKLTYDVYDAMYDKSDVKPFDGIYAISPYGYLATCDGGYRGSGYFEDITLDADYKNCNAIIFWVGEHPQTTLSMRKNLNGNRESTSRPFVHGLAVANRNARKSADEDLVKWWTVTPKAGDEVNASSNYTSFWASGNPGSGYSVVPTTNVRMYGYEITQGMMFYNEKVKSNAKYTVIPVKNIVDYMPDTYSADREKNTGWYLPTSGEWYLMLHSLPGATVSETRDKINEYIKKTSGWTTLGETTHYWTCQEAVDDPDASAVYVTGSKATQEGSEPTLYKSKQETCKVRPFIAF